MFKLPGDRRGLQKVVGGILFTMLAFAGLSAGDLSAQRVFTNSLRLGGAAQTIDSSTPLPLEAGDPNFQHALQIDQLSRCEFRLVLDYTAFQITGGILEARMLLDGTPVPAAIRVNGTGDRATNQQIWVQDLPARGPAYVLTADARLLPGFDPGARYVVRSQSRLAAKCFPL